MKITLIEPIGIDKERLLQYKEKMTSLGHDFDSYDDRPKEDEEIIKRSENSDIVIFSNMPFNSNVINSCNNLKMISVAFTGYEHVDIDTCKKKGIVVCNAAGYSTYSVAELTFGLAISVLRKIVWADNQTRKLSTRQGFLGTELRGKTFGIIGTGSIGTQVSKIANAFGCKVIAYSRTKKEGFNYVELDELLKKSDIVSLHVPLNEKTKHLIDEQKLKLMKKNAIIINTARGQVIDNDALADALNKGIIAGAGLDTVNKEPPLDSNDKILTAKNAVIMPHIGYATKEALNTRAEIVFDNIIKFIDGDVQNRVA